MNVLINGEKSEVRDGISVSELLTAKQVKMPETVTVELNGDILDRNTFGETVLKDAYTVEFLYFMGGGWANAECGTRNAERWSEIWA